MHRTGLVVVLAFASAAVAQPPKPIPTAIVGARVVVSSEKTLAKGTVILRDGLLADVIEGDDVPVPPDALVIDGKGLTVYAGFIDAASTRGFDHALRRSLGGPSAPEDLASDILAATKPDNRKGLTPEFEVRSALKDDDAQAPWRRVGFTAQLAMPEGGFFSGQSALVSLSGAPPREAVLRPIVFQHAALKNFPGADYPRAQMGVVAHCRQALLDAGWHARRNKAFEAGKLGGARPAFDPALDALNLAIEGKTAVVFEADSADEIHRALDFADEFKLTPVILGGRDAWKVKDRLKAGDTAVILRLNFTEPEDREKLLPKRAREERE